MRTEDGRIIQECLNGKPEVFGLLVDKYKEGIYAFVYSEIRDFHSTGQLTRTLDLGQKPSGAYLSKEKAAYWDGRNEDGEIAASDVYFYAMEAGEFADLKKMVITR